MISTSLLNERRDYFLYIIRYPKKNQTKRMEKHFCLKEVEWLLPSLTCSYLSFCCQDQPKEIQEGTQEERGGSLFGRVCVFKTSVFPLSPLAWGKGEDRSLENTNPSKQIILSIVNASLCLNLNLVVQCFN